MPPLPTGTALDAELVDLWARRAELSPTEWERLYRLVHAVLGSYHPKELASLNEDPAFYIQDFFIHKAMSPSVGHSEINHAGSLRVFYKRHLIDHLRRAKTEQHYHPPSDSQDMPGKGLENVAALQVSELPVDGLAELTEHGLSAHQVGESAQAFLQRHADWVAVYLAWHFCPDAEQREPLVKLAQRLNISAYHYKASQLGINWAAHKRGNQGKTFDKTLIGRWVSEDLGIAITPEHADVIHAIFKILCWAALNVREGSITVME